MTGHDPNGKEGQPEPIPLTETLAGDARLVGDVADRPSLVDAFHEPSSAFGGQGRVGV